MFITIEGIDGSGKSTLAAELAARLSEELKHRQEAPRQVVLARDPGGTAVGEAIRDVLARHGADMSPRTQSLLFSASRSALVEEVIRPALDEGAVVICDRFTDSTRVYQLPHWPGVAPLIEDAEQAAGPDLTFLLDLPAEVAYRRLSARDGGADIPDPEILRLEALRRRYLDLARDNPRIRVIDVSHTAPERLRDHLLTITLQELGL